MRISAKGRYALAAVTSMAGQSAGGEYITVISISEKLGISKIYLEQVFALLKRSGLVNSVKGAQGGYQLTRPAEQITVLDILKAVENSLFERTEDTVSQTSLEIEQAMRSAVFDALDETVNESLNKITLSALMDEVEKNKQDNALMYYI